MSALVLQGGVVTWDHGFGRADLDSGERAEPYTPYAIGDLSQTFGATLLLRKCIEENAATVNDRVGDWVDGFPETATTLGQLVAHVTPAGSFRYDRSRFAALTPVIEACSRRAYRELLDDEIFLRFGMGDSAPGTAMAAPTAADRELFDANRLDYHGAVLRRMATPYSVDSRGRMTPTTLTPTGVDASFGIVSSVRDLARFDAALSHNLLLDPPTRQGAWTQAAAHLPTGLGWFVQNYNGHLVVWQFGVVADAYSSLIVKVPQRDLTFILLANSDRLSTPFALENGDVTASVFARLFLRIYVP
jgi:CubicO group peptidase (beta-lactamase class C family)